MFISEIFARLIIGTKSDAGVDYGSGFNIGIMSELYTFKRVWARKSFEANKVAYWHHTEMEFENISRKDPVRIVREYSDDAGSNEVALIIEYKVEE